MSVVLDSSIYVSALRHADNEIASVRRWASGAPVWMSAVVLEELYAGAGERDRDLVERLERDFGRLRRIVVPNLSDWVQAGRALAWIGAEYGYEQIGRTRLSNDALIAMNAARLGIQVITSNKRDFVRLAEFRTFRWQLMTV